MTKLCPRGKAAAKRKFKVYPSAYANAYASKICAGKIKDPSGVKRKDFRGPKPSKAMGGRIGYSDGTSEKGVRQPKIKRSITFRNISKGQGFQMGKKLKTIDQINQERTRSPREVGRTRSPRELGRTNKAGGGLMEATERLRRQGLKNGGVARGCGAIMSDRRKKTKIV
jgi:hypothetical protein